MRRLTARLSILALLATPLSAWAQDTTTEAETPPPASEEEAAVPAEETVDTGLAMGTEEGADPETGETYVKETNGDWELQCIRTEDGEDPCQMYQLLQDGDGNPVAEVSLFRLPAGNQAVAGATIVVPLETLLTAQLRLSVDGSKAKRYPYSFCNPVGCYARIGLTNNDIAAFKRGIKAKVSVVPFAAPDQRVEVDMSLSGFTASYDKVSVVTE